MSPTDPDGFREAWDVEHRLYAERDLTALTKEN
jgi:hypothetical protein